LPRVFGRGFLPLRKRAASLPLPCGLISAKAAVLGAAYGAKPTPPNLTAIPRSHALRGNDGLARAAGLIVAAG